MTASASSRPAPMPLRVAHVVATSGATGVESHLLALLGGFDRAEVDPVLFVSRPGPLVDRARARGIAVELGAPARKLAFLSARGLARRWAGAFDLVHAHGARATFWAARAARVVRLPLVVTVHELRWRSWRPGPRRTLWMALERRALDRAARLIAVSGVVRDALVARRPSWGARTVVVPGSSPLLLDRVAPRAARAAGPLRLVSVGRLERVKGHERLLAALALVDPTVTLDLVGEGPLDRELRERASALGLGDRVRWHGAGADVPGLLASADAFVSATREETLGLAVLEAMAAGLPVVVPAVGGLVELVGDAGLQVSAEPDSDVPERLAAAITLLAGDSDQASRLGCAARDRAAGYDPVALAARVVAVYRDTIATASRAASGAR